MDKAELSEVLNEYKDANSRRELLEFLKDKIIEELEQANAETDRQKHSLNLMVREFEEELDWIETEKLSEFDPEQQ